MLRTSSILSSTAFTSPNSRKTFCNVKTRTLNANSDVVKIQIDIERMKAYWVHTEGRQERACIKVIMDLEKKRDAILDQQEKK